MSVGDKDSTQVRSAPEQRSLAWVELAEGQAAQEGREPDPDVSVRTTGTDVQAGDLIDELKAHNVPSAVDTSMVYSGTAYVTSQLSVLVARYAHIRGDLLVSSASRSALGDPRLSIYAERVAEYLRSAKGELESKKPKLPVASNLLSMAERALIWLYPAEVLADRCALVRAQLEVLRPQPETLLRQLDDVVNRSANDSQQLRTRQVLTNASGHLHEIAETRLIEDDLQVLRLYRVRRYLVLALALLLAAVPLIVELDVDPATDRVIWPVFSREGASAELLIFLGALCLAAVGAVGGIISGMLRVRDSRARLAEYRTSLLLLSLKPLLGAIAAVSLYLLLSWETINGIDVTSPGTYVFAAFLAGFSERYFLGILRRESTLPDVDKAG